MVAERPVAVAVEGDQHVFQMYKSGVLDVSNDECGTKVDHAVLVVGYGTDGGLEYWKIKNSWGTSWGEAGACCCFHFPTTSTTPASTLTPPPPPPPGYFRLIRNKNACGVATLATYPTAARPATRCSPYDDCSSCLAANDNTTATVVDAITGTSNAAPGVVEPCFWCASSESCEAAGGGTTAGHPFHQCERPTLSKGECVCSQHTGERLQRSRTEEAAPTPLPLTTPHASRQQTARGARRRASRSSRTATARAACGSSTAR